MKNLGVMLDCSRGAVYTEAALEKYIDALSKMGYNSLQLYTEDTILVQNEPYFGYLRGAYSVDEIKRLDSYAKSRGIELIPAIQTLAHLKGVTRWSEYASITDTGNILLMGDERTYALIENIVATCRKAYSSQRINIGMDEAFLVGRGRYADIHGNKNRMTAMLDHLKRVCEIADKYNFKPMMWSDMFFHIAGFDYRSDKLQEFTNEVIGLVPKNLDLIYWNYYTNDFKVFDAKLKTHKSFNNNVVFAGGAWSWTGITPHNIYSILNNGAALKACAENGIDDVIITEWKDDGAESSLFSVLPALMFAAENYRGNYDERDIKTKFEKIFGIDCDGFMSLDLPDLLDGKYTSNNPTKYMLFSDPFLGWLDSTVDESKAGIFAQAKAEIDRYRNDNNYGYIFETSSALCDMMSIKYTLGVRTRKAYQSKNKGEIAKIIIDYDELYKRVQTLYASFRAQWDRECKLNGFEHHDMRYGALLMRIQHCREILSEYVSGKRESISALDDNILPFNGQCGKTIRYIAWAPNSLIKYSED